MLAKYVYNTDIEDRYDHDDDDHEDDDAALSLCDLPIYGDDAAEIQSDGASSRWKQSSSSASSSSNDNDDDCFEFSFSSSQSMESCGWASNVQYHHPVHNNIIFCGKIIPRKEEPILLKKSTIHSSKAMPSMEKSSTRKISAAANKPSKWTLLMFGSVRIQGHMELRDIKKRQIKQRSHRSNCGDGEIVKSTTGEIKGNKGMPRTWSFSRAFGCIRASDVDSKVKASLWCVQQLRPGHS